MMRAIYRFNYLSLLSFLLIFSTNFLFAQGWERTYGGNTEDQPFEVISTIDGGYAIVGFTETQSRLGTNITLLKVDEAGNKEWSQSFGEEGDEVGFDLIQEPDGTYVIVGHTTSLGNGGKDIYLLFILQICR